MEKALLYAEAANRERGVPYSTNAVVDIGANIGWFSVIAAAKGYKTYMFEPMATNRAIIRHTMCRNPAFAENMYLFPYGAGERQVCRLYSDSGNVGDGHVSCGPTSDAFPNYVYRGAMQLVPIDDVIKEPIFLLKIDTEGYELKAMKSAKRLLGDYKLPWIISEISHMMGGKDQAAEYLELLWGYGYKVHMSSFEGPVIASQKEMQLYMPKINENGIYNIYCSLD
ncbi:hypothetical protein CYMTET_17035 [Cymbomonas tetramitiformis]|uniref:Methyltransferase FkbM domain-containing protein n=1 Tax=Cymbomonas tetramitiformis TaxID=36881 RepID=A0AAE0KST7_9CHLO|nr:hypothetical protein CYMTET_31804 [Cymbomonas tetramitiformis]KAK3259185.1 hypothetical protein CYMTET_31845 [Cymbomonas tetramitiformis]KAK3274805.1 hypothetical protein CYMTET_17035 [Cymbomonas tetramitiformis]